ncbi:MAG: SDR family oxidoreductase [Paracoccaceae bacterium]|nr:SDR family oxidoreductase [Paracoccaceae bacterium]
MNTGLKDRVILVTGASGGIGAATVRMLIKEEAKVIASGRNEDKLTELAVETGCDVLPFDLASELSVKAALSEIEVFGVVNCGGWGGEIASPMETDLEVFDKVNSINARGTLLVVKYASKGMIKAGLGGSIVNVSSQASLVGLAGHVSYASSKGAVDAMTRVSALELGKHNIRVNAVNPTVVMTPMSEWYWGRKDVGGPLLEAMPLGRWATEEDCAAPIIFLLSDASVMISGVCLPIDGGFTAV